MQIMIVAECRFQSKRGALNIVQCTTFS